MRIYNLIRAVTDPYPGAFCRLPDGSTLMVWWGATEGNQDGEKTEHPGIVEINDGRVLVFTGRGRIRLLDVQAEGKRMTGDEIIRYFKDKEGIRLQ